MLVAAHYGSKEARELLFWTYDAHSEKHETYRLKFPYDVKDMLIVRKHHLIVLSCKDMIIRIVSTRAERLRKVLERMYSGLITCLAYNEVQDLLVAGSGNGLKRYDLSEIAWANLNELPNLELKLEPNEWILSITFCYYNRFMIIHSDVSVMVVSYNTERIIGQVKCGKEVSLTAISYSQKLSYIVTGQSNGLVRLWDSKTLRRIHDFRDHSAAITSVNAIRNSTMVLSSSLDCTMRLWRVDTLELQQIFYLYEQFLGMQVKYTSKLIKQN